MSLKNCERSYILHAKAFPLPLTKHFVIMLVAVFILLGCQGFSNFTFNISHYDPDRAYNGYTFFETDYFYPAWFCVDMDGQTIWELPTVLLFGGYGIGLDVLDNGNVIINEAGAPKIFDPVNDSVVWAGVKQNVHHSLIRTPWDTIMFLTNEPFSVDYPPWSGCTILGDIIREIDRDTEETVWEWRLRDYLDPVEHHWERMCEAQTSADWSHCNTVKYYPGFYYDGEVHDVILLNSRHLDTFWMIDYPSGDILWSCGQHGDFGRREPPEGPLFDYAHEMEVTEGGNFLVYDNGNNRQPFISRALEFSVEPISGMVQEEWFWTDPDEVMRDGWGGDADRLPNGNTLITNVEKGRIIEVDTQGEKVWQLEMRNREDPDNEGWYTFYKSIRVEKLGP